MSVQSSEPTPVYRVVRHATQTLSGWVSGETDDRAQAFGWQATYGGCIQARFATGWEVWAAGDEPSSRPTA